MRIDKLRPVTVAALAVTALLASAPPVAVAAAGDVIRTGDCTGVGHWKIKASPENGRIEIEFEVDVNRPGQRWRVALFHDGQRVKLVRTTTGLRSGSFTVRDVEPNAPGTDHFRGRAVRIGGTNSCVGRVSL